MLLAQLHSDHVLGTWKTAGFATMRMRFGRTTQEPRAKDAKAWNRLKFVELAGVGPEASEATCRRPAGRAA